MKNYYQILEISSDASPDIVKEQYLFLLQAWHPDKFPNAAQKIKAEEKTKDINEAYAVINNPLKRAEYDKIISPTRKGRAEKERSGAENRTPPNITAIEVVKVWKQIGAAMMGENVHLAALMNSVKTVDVQGITLVLGFASEIVKSKMKPAEMERTRKALFDIFGVMFDIRCIVVPRQTRSSAK